MFIDKHTLCYNVKRNNQITTITTKGLTMKKVFILYILIICIATMNTHAMEEDFKPPTKTDNYEVCFYVASYNAAKNKPCGCFYERLKVQKALDSYIKFIDKRLTEVEKAILYSNYTRLKVLLGKKHCIVQDKPQRLVIKAYYDRYKKTKVVYMLNHTSDMLLAEELFDIRVDLFKDRLKSFLPDGKTLSEIRDKDIERLCMKLKPEGKVLDLLKNLNS